MKIANLSVVVSIFTTLVAFATGDKRGSGNWLDRTIYNDDIFEEGTQSLKPYPVEESAFSHLIDTPTTLDEVDEDDFFEFPKKTKSKREKLHRSCRHKRHKHKSSKRKSKNRVNKRHTKRGMINDEDISDWNDSDNYYGGGKRMHHASHKHAKHSAHCSHHMSNSESFDPIDAFKYEDTKDFFEEEPNQRLYSMRANDSKKHTDESKYLYIPVQTGNEFQPFSDINDENSEKDIPYLVASNNEKTYESATLVNETNNKDLVNGEEERILTPTYDNEKDEDAQKQIIALHSQIQSFMPFFNDLAIISESAVFKRQLEENTAEPMHSIEERTMSECNDDLEKDGTKLLSDDSLINSASSILGQYQEQEQSFVPTSPDGQCSATEFDREPRASILSLFNGELLLSAPPIVENTEQNVLPQTNPLKQDMNETELTSATTLQNETAVEVAYLVNEQNEAAIPIDAQNITAGLQKQDTPLLLEKMAATTVTPANEITTTIAQQERGILPLFGKSAFVAVTAVPEKKAPAASSAIKQNATLDVDTKPLDNGLTKIPQDEIMTNVTNKSSIANASQGVVASLATYKEEITDITTVTSPTDYKDTTKIPKPLDAVMSTVKNSENVQLADIVAFTESVNVSRANLPLTPLALVAIIPDATEPTTPVKDNAIVEKPKAKNIDFLTRLYSFFFNI